MVAEDAGEIAQRLGVAAQNLRTGAFDDLKLIPLILDPLAEFVKLLRRACRERRTHGTPGAAMRLQQSAGEKLESIVAIVPCFDRRAKRAERGDCGCGINVCLLIDECTANLSEAPLPPLIRETLAQLVERFDHRFGVATRCQRVSDVAQRGAERLLVAEKARDRPQLFDPLPRLVNVPAAETRDRVVECRKRDAPDAFGRRFIRLQSQRCHRARMISLSAFSAAGRA